MYLTLKTTISSKYVYLYFNYDFTIFLPKTWPSCQPCKSSWSGHQYAASHHQDQPSVTTPFSITSLWLAPSQPSKFSSMTISPREISVTSIWVRWLITLFFFKLPQYLFYSTIITLIILANQVDLQPIFPHWIWSIRIQAPLPTQPWNPSVWHSIHHVVGWAPQWIVAWLQLNAWSGWNPVLPRSREVIPLLSLT